MEYIEELEHRFDRGRVDFEHSFFNYSMKLVRIEFDFRSIKIIFQSRFNQTPVTLYFILNMISTASYIKKSQNP